MTFFCLNKCVTWFTDKCYKTTVIYILVISLATLISPKKKKKCLATLIKICYVEFPI